MLTQHADEDLAFLAGFEPTVTVDVDGLGPTCFCHGSPRSDEECVTERTPAERVHEFMAGVDASVVVTAHVHVQLRPRRSTASGSSGPGASGCRTRVSLDSPTGRSSARTSSFAEPTYDVEAAVALMRATDDPSVEAIVELMLSPPSRDEVIADAERAGLRRLSSAQELPARERGIR